MKRVRQEIFEPEAILTMYAYIGIDMGMRREGPSHGLDESGAKSGMLADERLPSPARFGLPAIGAGAA